MALYYLLIDAAFFAEQARPALAASWRQRSFEPCRALCRAVVPRATAFAVQFHLGTEQSLVAQVADGLPFDRVFWQHLVGEVLWFGALDIPELPTAADTLERLIAPDALAVENAGRAQWLPIQQVHHGSRDVLLGGYYRPDCAGWNDRADLNRLAGFLDAVRTDLWRPEQLVGAEGIPAEDRAEELEYARDCLAALRELYHRAEEKHCILVCETL